MKRWIALLMCALWIAALAACKPAEEIAVPHAAEPLSSGRYVESEIALPLPEGVSDQMVLGMREDENGITVFTCTNLGEAQDWRNRYFRHTIAADGTVTTGEEGWLNELAPFGGNEMHIVAARDGGLYMSFSDFDEKNNSQAHLLLSSDDGRTGAALTGDGLKKLGILTGFSVLDDGRIAACDFYDGTALLLDREGNLIEELGGSHQGRISGVAGGGSAVAFEVTDRNLVGVYNAADGSYTEYDYQFSENSFPLLSVGADGAVYLLDNTGVYRRAAGGTLWERLVEGSVSTFGLPGFYAGLFTVDATEPFPTLYVSDMNKLLAYTYDPAATAVADKELTVFSLHTNETVQQAIVAFSRARGDVKVTYTVAMEGASGGTEQDYIKALNTELLAGTGPDILILDGLPVDSYIEKDVLTDLTEVVAGTEPALPNIFSAYARDNALYAVPTGFTVPLAVALPGTERAFDSLSALAAAAEASAGLPLLSSCAFSYRTLALYLLMYYGDSLYAGDAAGVETFLTDARRVSAALGCTDRLCEGWMALSDVTQDELYETFSAYVCSPQVYACASGMARDILTQPMGSVMQCMEPFAYAETAGGSLVSVNGQFVPTGVAGVNKASGEPEAAAAFVQALLSHDAQGGNQYVEQFPVNAQALSEMLAYQNDGVSSGFMLDDGTDFTAEWPKPAQRAALDQVIAALDKPILANTALSDMLLPAVVACLDGSSTVSESAEQIASLLATYLSE